MLGDVVFGWASATQLHLYTMEGETGLFGRQLTLFYGRPQGFHCLALHDFFLCPMFDEWLFSWLPRAVE